LNQTGRTLEENMEARMKSPVYVIPEVMPALYAVANAAKKGGLPARTIDLVHLRIVEFVKGLVT